MNTLTRNQVAELKALSVKAFVWSTECKDLVETTAKPTVYQWPTGETVISAEDGQYLVDFDSNYIAPEIEQWATANGLGFEWHDSGTLAVFVK